MICDITETALYIEYKNSSLLQCTLDYVLGGGGGRGAVGHCTGEQNQYIVGDLKAIVLSNLHT